MNFFRAATRTSSLIKPLTNTRSVAGPMWARWLSDSLRTKLDQDIKAKPVVLFMKGTADEPMCGFSRAAVQIMQVQGVDFKDVQTFNVLADDDLRQGIKDYSEWPTIPQVYINGEFVGGCDILLNMHQSGDLEDLLVKNGIIPEEIEDPKQ
ncbi:thioredoxin-like protein [Absidia repens]|uniref:Monothiol glutaredoxin-5, mitochondrial n=1 Tax=Absidia repens TaxID=90262 RepID=A0A1X2ISX9_9FUNG|nr:thioredoxin-like protein [Absidia repens]